MIFARYLDASKYAAGEASDDVELFRADQHLTTERILYDPGTEVMTIPGTAHYEDQQLWLEGNQATYDFLKNEGQFSSIDYGLMGTSAHGQAKRIEMAPGGTSWLYELSYTSCPEDRSDWMIYAKKLELRQDEGMGVAHGAKLVFKGVPILYAPYFTFPIDDRRKSGFLYPSISNTNDNGFEFNAPWYWNIAPNQDATLEPRYYTNRGAMLSGDYRFLTPRTWGEFDFDYMPFDHQTEEDRYHYTLEHNANPRDRWHTNLVIDRVSDDEYFQDFGSNIYQTSIQFLRSSAVLNGVGAYWNFEMLVDDFQVLDDNVLPENEPYRRVPRIAFLLDQPLGRAGASFKLGSELVYFDRDSGTTGARLDLLPSLYWQRYTRWGYIKPSLGYRFTGYDLDRIDDLEDSTPTRGTTIASLDSGLVFDRINANGSTQTLEPRLFYLYVPYKQQNDLPEFDTAPYTFGFSQLFNTDRFTGADRQSNANQLSVALSTQNFAADDGEVQWSLNAGQIFYFESLKVQLEDETEFNENLSPFITEFNWHPFTRFSARAGVQWDWEQNEVDVTTLGFSYAGSTGQRTSFDYRFRRDRVDQFDFRI
ncbi:MAG: LPS-assembly protein LptD, partial [Lysobacterales bacterium]